MQLTPFPPTTFSEVIFSLYNHLMYHHFSFLWAAGLETVPTRNFSHPKQMYDIQSRLRCSKCQPIIAEKQELNAGNGGPTRWDGLFLSPLLPTWKNANGPPTANQCLSTTEPRCNHAGVTLYHLHPFCLHRTYLKINVAQSDFMKLKVSWSHFRNCA